MARSKVVRTYSPTALDAIELLGKEIAIARRNRKESAQTLANRVGIARNTLSKIESGDPTCEIGLVFELARVSGVSLFSSDPRLLASELNRASTQLSLLPKSSFKPKMIVDDDF